MNHCASAGNPSLRTRFPEALQWDFPALTSNQSCACSPLLLCPEVGFDDEPVHGKVDNERSHGGIEHSAGKQLVC